MTTTLEDGRLLVRRPDGGVSFDTDRPNFVITDFKSGSFTIGDLPKSGVITTLKRDLGAVTPVANIVVGNLIISGVSSGTLYTQWSSLGGTNILSMGYGKMFPDSIDPRWQTYITGIPDLCVGIASTFYVQSNRLYCDVERYSPFFVDDGGAVPPNIGGRTLRYFAFCGFFN